ncbi:hypothetical protein KUV50_02115 [Membranicola marinus]|uniref:Chondroitin AC lyase n=1 Tax=Membranihabitans marinus TaxID=1227546 RepID=A0A953HW76_9BACT|nr:polysaccharide lyase family 8 super-sandwich domain-containing protein [Membranihabitans marinus]MBY5956912.1 hypothetical protein [Membranihabitans marinus]
MNNLSQIKYYMRSWSTYIIIAFYCSSSFVWAASDMEVIKQRVIGHLLEAQVSDAAVKDIIDGVDPSGFWPDIDYVDTSRTGFQHGQHLRRMLDLAKAYHQKNSDYYKNTQLKKVLFRTLDFWLDHDFICANWWWNQLGTPRYLVNVLLLMEDDLTPETLNRTVRIVDRSNLQASGARPSGDRIKMAGILAKKLLVLDDENKFAKVIKVIEGEIKFSEGRGMQVDYSFHHRLDRVNNTLSYGLGYAQAFAEWAALVSDTKYRFGESSIHQLIDYYLDGICKMMVYGVYPDPGAKNRSLARPGTLQGYWVEAVDHLLLASDYRGKELHAVRAARLGESADLRKYNKFFWQSEYMSHQRPEYFSSARMFSTRNQNMEVPYNKEGLKNHYLGDGANFISRTGQEYFDIFPVLDWRRIPGTTIVQKPEMPPSQEVQVKGLSDFAGGVTDGQNGAAAFEYIKERDSLRARKGWFFMDDVVVCLGAGIATESVFPVNTTVNQSLLHGTVYVANDQKIFPVNNSDNQMIDHVRWVWHDRIGYFFPEPERIHLSNHTQRGSWYEINQQSDSSKDTIHQAVFKLWVDHGHRPQTATYAYVVIPDVSFTEIGNRNYSDRIKIIANTNQLQAVQHRLKGLVQAVFYEAVELDVSPQISFSMDAPGMVQLNYRNGKVISLAVSDPSRKLKKLNFSVSQKLTMDYPDEKVTIEWDPDQLKSHFTVNLPQNEWAGSSVVLDFE